MIWLGRLVPDLDDVLAEIGLRHLDARRFEMAIEPNLFRHHGFALGDEARACFLADLQNNVPRVGRARRIMDMASALHHLPLIGFEIEVEMIERVVLDGARFLAEFAELRQLRPGQAALDDEAAFDVEKRPLELRIFQRAARVVLELLRRCLGQSGSLRLARLPDGRHIGHAGENFRDMAALDA